MQYPLLAACCAARKVHDKHINGAPAAEKRRRRGPSTGADATAGATAGCGGAGAAASCGARTGCGAAGAAGIDTETALAVTCTHCGGGCTGGGDASSSSSGTCRCVAICCQVTRVFGMALRRLPVVVGGKRSAVDASICLQTAARRMGHIPSFPTAVCKATAALAA